jgi:hypothetical protein
LRAVSLVSYDRPATEVSVKQINKAPKTSLNEPHGCLL